MNLALITACVFLLSLCGSGQALAQNDLQRVSLQALAVDTSSGIWAAASQNRWFTSEDQGATWRERPALGASDFISDLVIMDSTSIVLATPRGIYTAGPLTANPGATPQLKLQSADCLSLTRLKTDQLLATCADALWVSDDGKRWQKHTVPQSWQPLIDAAALADRIYLLTANGLYSTHLKDWQWQRIAAPFTEEPLDGKESIISRRSGEEDDSLPLLRGLLAVPETNDLYWYFPGGIRQFNPQEATLRTLPRTGLPIRINDLISHPQGLTAATERGIFRLIDGESRWQRLEAFPEINIHRLTLHGDKLLAASAQGWFNESNLNRRHITLDQLPTFQNEPTIGDIQEAAIQYADVHPDKIRRWKTRARFQALLPSVSLGYDRALDTYVTSRGSSGDETTDRLIFAEDPSHGWDVSVSWDLAEWIWNNDETSIDNRSRLTVQLRESILNEVTRLYFERRRLQIMLQEPQAYPDLDWEDRLRLDEVTAQIDALSGGYLSRQLSAINEN